MSYLHDTPEKPHILYRGWSAQDSTVTLDDLKRAIAHHAKGNSAFAREVLDADPRAVRKHLAGAGMRSRSASKVRDYMKANKLKMDWKARR